MSSHHRRRRQHRQHGRKYKFKKVFGEYLHVSAATIIGALTFRRTAFSRMDTTTILQNTLLITLINETLHMHFLLL